ncbi:hypothetical protein, partial [Staphylococcus capitis]|uniref:hypothetical protein n=1 Tax=Staphylococcus capitis TaxID=29388 RepID=UPI001F4F0ED1
ASLSWSPSCFDASLLSTVVPSLSWSSAVPFDEPLSSFVASLSWSPSCFDASLLSTIVPSLSWSSAVPFDEPLSSFVASLTDWSPS